MPPGEITNSKVQTSQISGLDGLIEINSVAYSPGARLALKVYNVSPGSEYRYLAEIAQRSNVLATSLNYLGQFTDGNSSSLLATPTAINAASKACWYLNDSTKTNRVFENGIASGLKTLTASPNQPLVAVIDSGKDHTQVVVSTLLDAYNAQKPEKDLAVLALYVKDYQLGQAVDLLTYSNLLLALCDTGKRIAAINLSVDIGLNCGTINGMPQPLGAWIYSFPFFERLLDEFIRVQIRNGYDPPIVFAAAGNKSFNQQQWRLAHPASLPNAVAVTHLYDSQQPNNERVDLPTVSPLKPCFAEFIDKSDVQSTSRACASLTGKWAYWDSVHTLAQQKLGQFDKLTLLLSSSKGYKKTLVNPNAQPWVPCVVRQFTIKEKPKPLRHLFQDLLQKLNREFIGHEFLITGSGAFVAKLFSLQNKPADRKLYSQALNLLGDVDLLYTGPALPQKKSQAIQLVIQKWVKECFDLEKERSPKLQIHSLKNWSGTIHLLQCVIPAACLFLTASGIIDPWQESSDFTINPENLPLTQWSPPLMLEGALSFYSPPEAAWEWNPQYRSGSSGLAHAFVIWINLNLLRAQFHLLSSVQITEPQPVWLVPDELKDHSVLSDWVKVLLGQEYSAEKLVSSHHELLFGKLSASTITDRLTHRLERTALLIDNQNTHFWTRARKVSELLQQAWNRYLTESIPTIK